MYMAADKKTKPLAKKRRRHFINKEGLAVRKRRKVSHPIYWIAVGVVLSLGTMGVSYSYWTGGLVLEGTVRTGYLDPCFTQVEVLSETTSQGQAEVGLEEEGKALGLMIEKAEPGYSLQLRYRIANRGTIPLQYETTVGQTPDMQVEIKAPEGRLEPGEEGEGTMELRLNSIQEDSLYELSTELVFRQAIP